MKKEAFIKINIRFRNEKKIPCSPNFDQFSKMWDFADFCKKTINSGGEMTFLWQNIILYAIYSKFTTFTDSEKIQIYFWKKTNVFKKPEVRSYLRISLLQSPFTANLL